MAKNRIAPIAAPANTPTDGLDVSSSHSLESKFVVLSQIKLSLFKGLFLVLFIYVYVWLLVEFDSDRLESVL